MWRCFEKIGNNLACAHCHLHRFTKTTLGAKECALVHLCSSQAPLALSNWWWCYSCKEARLYERLSVKAAVWRPHAERYRDFLVP
jgi:hypothetical protein